MHRHVHNLPSKEITRPYLNYPFVIIIGLDAKENVRTSAMVLLTITREVSKLPCDTRGYY